jgi:hypothetical protein
MTKPPVYVAFSRCECQASLGAELTEDRLTMNGTAFLLGKRENAPAHSIEPEREVFDIGWLCPFCGRNTLRTFAASALRKVTSRSLAAPKAP